MTGQRIFQTRIHPLILCGAVILFPGCGSGEPLDGAAQPAISLARVQEVRLDRGEDGWEVSVTVHHEDSGWDHYADWWRITDESGRELARRVLRHPHVEEQPFTRSLQGIEFMPEIEKFVVEAHCSVHGCGGNTVRVDLLLDQGPGFTVNRQIRGDLRCGS